MKRLLKNPQIFEWLQDAWRQGVGYGRELVESATGPVVSKTDLDDLLVELVEAGWLRRGDPMPSVSQLAFASLTYPGKDAASAYPTHFWYAPVRTCAAYEALVRSS